MRKVTVKDVLGWIHEAMEAAQADPGDTGGTTTALSYRELRVDFGVETGGITFIFVRTRNDGFTASGRHTYRAVTHDGAVVLWERELGVPTGEDWLPEAFKAWMQGV
jgi:hypothetical protein